MKTKLLLIALIAIGFGSCQAQSQTTVYAKNSDISDNLDLRAVASMFGDSDNLQDFERRLNDPKYQISNLDLNGDDQVDYLRVIESVEDRTHVVIIQAVLDRDVYQDIATIDIERDNSNKVVVQVVGNSYLYGDNYIYEPVYSVAPVIYTSFWVTNYRPYYSTWGWNVYPTYYAAWRPYPIYRYRNNVNVYINVNNRYNYVNTRRSYRAPAIYQTRRSYGYETMRPNNSFSQRHSNVNNRYELDQRRVASREANRGSNTYNTNRSNSNRPSGTENRNYAENRSNTNRSYNAERANSNRDNTSRPSTPVRVDNNNTQRTESNRGYSSENRSNTNRTSTATAPQQQTQPTRSYSENRSNTSRPTSAPQQQTQQPTRSYSESNRSSSNNNSSRAQSSQNTQRSEAPRASQEQRSSQPQRESGSGSSSRGGGRRG